MTQLRTFLTGPHGTATVVTWTIAGLAAVIALVHALRRRPPYRRWSRAAAVGFPLSIAGTLAVGSVAGAMRGAALEVTMFLRMAGFWATVTTAPFAVGQVFELRPPRWLHRTHLALAAGFLALLVVSDLAFTRNDVLHPPSQFGPLAVPLLVPVASLAGWWLLACLGRVQTRIGLVLFALGGSITTLALIVAALVVDPMLADHFLVVGFLPVLAAASVVELQGSWRDRTRPPRPARHRSVGTQ